MLLWRGAFLFSLALSAVAANPQISFDADGAFQRLPKGLKQIWLAEKEARFTRHPNTFAWISDVEHVTCEKTNEIFLADADPPYYLCGATIPAGTFFELFSYHWFVTKEKDLLGERINYKLIARNDNPSDVVLELEGIGTTRSWDHHIAWEKAFRGDGRRIIRIKPGETVALWEERRIVEEFPWSGILLGRSSGDLWVCDYCWLGEKDPGIQNARPMPDLSLPPVLNPSFSRGTAQLNGATIDLFPMARTASGRMALSQIKKGVYSFAIADSPGGPLGKPCRYAVVPKSFEADVMNVLDPVSQKSHLFFGGNYPVMYKLPLALANDSASTKTVSIFVSSNDKYNVDTLAGIWFQGKMTMRRVPIVGKKKHWKVIAITLPAGQILDEEITIVPIGSRWCGMVVSFAIQ